MTPVSVLMISLHDRSSGQRGKRFRVIPCFTAANVLKILLKLVYQHQVGVIAVKLGHQQPASVAGHCGVSAQRRQRSRKLAHHLAAAALESKSPERLGARWGSEV